MTRFRMASGVVLLLALHCWAAPAAEKVVYLSTTSRQLIKELVVAEVWRPGGANSEALAEVLEEFLRAGKLEAASCLVGEALPFVYRRLIDPAPLAAALRGRIDPANRMSHADWRSVEGHLDGCVELETLSQNARFAIYRRLISEKTLDGPHGLTNVDACLRGLWEDPHTFLLEAENTCFNPKGVWARVAAGDFGKATLRVARARACNTPMDAVLELVDTAVKAELRPGELVDGIAPDVLLEEALLALLMDKQTKAVARLKRIWLAIPVADRPQGLSVEGRAALVAKGRMDSEPPRDTHAGRSLMRAIRALGDPTFQSKNLQFEKSLLLGPEHSREELRHRGLLKAEPE